MSLDGTEQPRATAYRTQHGRWCVGGWGVAPTTGGAAWHALPQPRRPEATGEAEVVDVRRNDQRLRSVFLLRSCRTRTPKHSGAIQQRRAVRHRLAARLVARPGHADRALERVRRRGLRAWEYLVAFLRFRHRRLRHGQGLAPATVRRFLVFHTAGVWREKCPFRLQEFVGVGAGPTLAFSRHRQRRLRLDGTEQLVDDRAERAGGELAVNPLQGHHVRHRHRGLL